MLVAEVAVRRLAEHARVQQPEHAVVESPASPVQVFAIVGVVRVHARRRSERPAETLQGALSPLPGARLHRGAVERHFESAGVQIHHEVAIVWVVHRLGEREIGAPFLAPHRPDRLRGPHPEGLEQAVYRSHVLDGRHVGVVHYGEREARPGGKRPAPVPTGVAHAGETANSPRSAA